MTKVYKIGYYLCIALTIFMLLLCVGSLVVVLMPDENTTFEINQLVVPAVCLVLSGISFALTRFIKNKF